MKLNFACSGNQQHGKITPSYYTIAHLASTVKKLKILVYYLNIK